MERALEHELIVRVGGNILSPLGMSTEATLQAVLNGESALRRYEGYWNLPEPFVASLLDFEAIDRIWTARDGAERRANYTDFERIAILSASFALEEAGIRPESDRVLFILSTTKGNVVLLESDNRLREEVLPDWSARRIAAFFHNPNPAIVVSNACTSGLCAQITAMRALWSGRCDHAVVIGADRQSRFIVSGFQSFKALSLESCRPFDRQRTGLNLGEAAATIVYTRRHREEIADGDWIACRGAIRNDANHISGPSRTGEGCYRALQSILQGVDPAELAVVNVHGTATLYNDEMESIALNRAGLSGIPVNGLKGYFGHTMGAAGVLESILTMHAVDAGIVLGTRGYAECGVSHPLRLSAQHAQTSQRCFVKMLSGFGGCNAAMLFKRGGVLC